MDNAPANICVQVFVEAQVFSSLAYVPFCLPCLGCLILSWLIPWPPSVLSTRLPLSLRSFLCPLSLPPSPCAPSPPGSYVYPDCMLFTCTRCSLSASSHLHLWASEPLKGKNYVTGSVTLSMVLGPFSNEGMDGWMNE